jgi:hypothetical protein
VEEFDMPEDSLSLEESDPNAALEAIKSHEGSDPGKVDTSAGSTGDPGAERSGSENGATEASAEEGGKSAQTKDGAPFSTAGISATSSSASESAPAAPLGFDPAGASHGTVP